MGDGALDADGADRLRGRCAQFQEEDACRREDRYRHVGRGILRGTLRISRFPRAHGHAQALSISAPAVLDGGYLGRYHPLGRRERAGSVVLLDHAAARQARRADPRLPRGAKDRQAGHPCPYQQGRRLYPGPLHRGPAQIRDQPRLGIGLVVVCQRRRVHPQMGTGAHAARGAGTGLPAAESPGRGQVRHAQVRRRGHGDHRHARGVPGEVPQI